MGFNSIAKRMGGAHSRVNNKGANYRQVLFSMDDMASFEALLDEVNHVEYDENVIADRKPPETPAKSGWWRPRCCCSCGTWTIINGIVLISLLGGSFAIYETQVGSRPDRLEDAIEENGRGHRHRDAEREAAAARRSSHKHNNGEYDKEGVGDGGGDGKGILEHIGTQLAIAHGTAKNITGSAVNVAGKHLKSLFGGGKQGGGEELEGEQEEEEREEEALSGKPGEEGDGEATQEKGRKDSNARSEGGEGKEGRKEKSGSLTAEGRASGRGGEEEEESEGFFAMAKRHVGGLLSRVTGGGTEGQENKGKKKEEEEEEEKEEDGLPGSKMKVRGQEDKEEKPAEKIAGKEEKSPQPEGIVDQKVSVAVAPGESEEERRARIEREDEELRKRHEQEEEEHRKKLDREEEEHRKRLEEYQEQLDQAKKEKEQIERMKKDMLEKHTERGGGGGDGERGGDEDKRNNEHDEGAVDVSSDPWEMKEGATEGRAASQGDTATVTGAEVTEPPSPPTPPPVPSSDPQEEKEEIAAPPPPDEDSPKPKVKGIAGAGDYADDLDKWANGKN